MITATTESTGAVPRFVFIEEAQPKKRLPVPIRPIKPNYWTNGTVTDMWEKMLSHPYMLSDEARRERDDLFRATMQGHVHWFELGDGNGYIHAWDVRPGGNAKMNIEWRGNTREFIRNYGSVNECRELWMKALFKWLKPRRFTVEISMNNKPGHKLLNRLGFSLEGITREGWKSAGNVADMAVYGILASEVNGG